MRSLLKSRFWRRARREEGTATIEFVIVVPVILTIFMASVEAGFYMAKHVMMERGLDMVIRDVRLGRIPNINHNVLRARLCEATPILNNCGTILKVEMRPVSTATFNMPTLPATCIDRGESSEPLADFVPGESDELMVVRICAVQDPIFPSTGIGLQLRADAQGGYQMIAASLYVVEPD
jgi:hypothetical protein